MRQFGLIGFPLGHSFSAKYFTRKFAAEGITDATYALFELPDLSRFQDLLKNNPNLCGLSVTIPNKQTIIPFLDELEPEAEKIGAVNTIKISEGKLVGFNTDFYGFTQALQNFYPQDPASKALVLGTGGASRAVQAALEKLDIPYQVVSRSPLANQLSYKQLSAEILADSNLIINTTPLGTFPNVNFCPDIPYQFLTPQHYLFDLVYNPAETLFMKNGKEMGAKTKNGYEMLILQAEVAWQIWNR